MSQLIYKVKKNGIEYKVSIRPGLVREYVMADFTLDVVDEYHNRKRKSGNGFTIVQEKTMILYADISNFLKKHGINLGYAYRPDRNHESIEHQLTIEQVNYFKGLRQLQRDKVIESLLK